MSHQIETLVKLAKEQGWTVETIGNGKLRWTNPEGARVETSLHPSGSTYYNARSNLKQAGLQVRNLPGGRKPKQCQDGEITIRQIQPERNEATVTASETIEERISASEGALDAAVEMIEELADQFKLFRDTTIGTITEFRGKLQHHSQLLEGLSKDIGKELVTPADVKRAVDQLRADFDARLSEVQAKADPIAHFRSRLGR